MTGRDSTAAREWPLGTGKTVVIAIGLITYSAVHSREVLSAWRHSPSDAFGWLAFLIWLLPVVILWNPRTHDPAAWFAGLVATLVGVIGSLDLFVYFGLAITVSGLLPASIPKIAWLVSAIGWMPQFSDGVNPDTVIWARMGTVLMGLVVYAWTRLLSEDFGEEARS